MLALVQLPTASIAADERCTSCGPVVLVTGDFLHRKDAASVVIEGATNGAAAFREEINGKEFRVSIAGLPAGRYTLVIGETETLATSAGERVFDIACGDVKLVSNLDIFSAAGGARKAHYVTGVIEHEEDTIKGAVLLTFTASKGTAKFNTIEVKNATGSSVTAFSASELAGLFTGSATAVPQISDAPIYRDSSKPMEARIKDLIRRMSLAEKVAQLQGGQSGAPAIARLELPSYNYWNEALHGVANNGIATVFPEPVGGASTC